jgi:hypothetical protein
MKYDVYLLTPILTFERIEAKSDIEAMRKAEQMLIHLPEDVLDPEEPHRLVAIAAKEENDDQE